MQDRPTAIELLRAAREFCEKDLQPALVGRVRFHARVLQNVLGILERELESEEPALHRERAHLAHLLGKTQALPDTQGELAKQVKAWNVELASQIRAGAFDDRWDDVLERVTEVVAEKLAIANPNYASSTGASKRSTR